MAKRTFGFRNLMNSWDYILKSLTKRYQRLADESFKYRHDQRRKHQQMQHSSGITKDILTSGISTRVGKMYRDSLDG